ncbi:MAG TPA: hypothetical protein PLC59_00265 [Bacteroidales bacterium]|jgi:hypothetical protein|nr:hypothetical protein [Bacteroidales bacterium]HQI44497.1 hypothetical protein [Bacteroidales bacterium]
MKNESYIVDILIDNKPIRKFPFEDKIYIEARKDKEYSIRIKNNSTHRILAVTSVDGLNVLTGKFDTEYSDGYVINGYNSLIIDGFRVSDEKVAGFIFDYKDKSYAASKKDGSEKNVGVIGVRIFEEKFVPFLWNTVTYDNDNIPVKGGFNPYSPNIQTTVSCDNSLKVNCFSCSTTTPIGFDMGTKWGNSKESPVIEVEFNRGNLSYSTNIYYASRKSLLEMGVPMDNKKQVSFPKPFKNRKYAKPPEGWQG